MGLLVFLYLMIMLLLFSASMEVYKIEKAKEIRQKKFDEVISLTGLEKSTVEEIFVQAERYDLSPEFILALIKVESDFQKEAVGPQGAVGLGQIMPSTAEFAADKLGLDSYTERDLIKPIYNVRITSFYLSRLLDKYNGNYYKALTAYNRGGFGLREYVAAYGTARSDYASKVLQAKIQFAKQLEEFNEN